MSTARLVNGSVVLAGPLTATVNSGRLNAQAFAYQDVLVGVHISAVTGTSPTLVVKLQDSVDGTTWTDVTGCATGTLNAAGSSLLFGHSAKAFQRVVATVGGTTPNFTATVAAVGFPEV